MATCILTLYKNTKLENSKNDIIEDIETYLAGLESIVVDSSFQYQRFELDKTIKVNMDQAYQTKANNINKYNYCKITTEVDNETVVYYYFITKARQIAQKTIELTLRMDTLNTFHYSETLDNGSYTLSSKTTINREHKDRLTYVEEFTPWIVREPTPFDNSRIEAWKSQQWISDPLSRGTSRFEFDFRSFVFDYKAVAPAGVNFPLAISPEDVLTSILVVNDSLEVVETYTNYFNANIEVYTDRVKIRVSDTEYKELYYTDLNNSYFRLFFSISYSTNTGTASTFTPDSTWNYIKKYIISDEVLVQGDTQKTYKREIYPYQEEIQTHLFKKSEETLYDADGTSHWYTVFRTDPEVNTSVDVILVPDHPVSLVPGTGSYTLTASDKLIRNIRNEDEVIYTRKFNIIKTNRGPSTVEIDGSRPKPNEAGKEVFKIGDDTYDRYDGYDFVAYRNLGTDTAFQKIDVFKYTLGNIYSYTTPYRTYPNIGEAEISSIELSGIDYIGLAGGSGGKLSSGKRYEIILIPNQSTTGSTSSIKQWSELDLTDQKLIKAFAFPYCPCQYLVGNNVITGNEAFGLINTNELHIKEGQSLPELFNYTKEFYVESPLKNTVLNITNTLDIGKAKTRDIKYESKLYHSDYYQPKFVYDSFSFPFYLELVDIDAYYNRDYLDKMNVSYIVSSNVQSKFAFIFDDYILKQSDADYDNVLTIERNNEKALFNNDYLAYIKSGGYSYDQKHIQNQNITSGITSGISLAASIASLVAGIAGSSTGLGIPMIVGGVAGIAGSVGGVIKTIINAQDQDEAFAHKMQQLQQQASTVQGNEDIDILTAISGNKAKLVYYGLSDIMKNAMWDLFHYCGYATNEQKVPQTNTRLYFNFIQADIVYDDYTFNDDVAEDIKNRWAQGVTFFHKVDSSYDLDQEYENFEVSLL